MAKVLITVALEDGTVEWKSRQQLQWLQHTPLLPSCSCPATPAPLPSPPVLVQVFGAAMEALGGTHPYWLRWQPPEH